MYPYPIDIHARIRRNIKLTHCDKNKRNRINKISKTTEPRVTKFGKHDDHEKCSGVGLIMGQKVKDAFMTQL